jgi:hypothetical protein
MSNLELRTPNHVLSPRQISGLSPTKNAETWERITERPRRNAEELGFGVRFLDSDFWRLRSLEAAESRKPAPVPRLARAERSPPGERPTMAHPAGGKDDMIAGLSPRTQPLFSHPSSYITAARSQVYLAMTLSLADFPMAMRRSGFLNRSTICLAIFTGSSSGLNRNPVA